MTFIVHVLTLIALSTPSMAARMVGKSFYRKTCERLFDPDYVAAAAEFTKHARELLDASNLTRADVRLIGENIITYPDLFFEALAEGHTSRLSRIMANPELAEVFFKAHPANALFSADMLGVADHQEPARYQFMIEPLERLITMPTAEISRRYPGFRGPREQGEALVLVDWLKYSSPGILNAAYQFLNPPRWEWSLLRLSKKISPFNNYRFNRAHVARGYLNRATKAGQMTPEILESLVRFACQSKHPFKQDLWEVFEVGSLNDNQKRRLSDFWHADNFDENERRWLKHRAKDLITGLEILR